MPFTLCTGAAGFFGSRLCEYLTEQGHVILANDIVHPDDAWRLDPDSYKGGYAWKGVQDLEEEQTLEYVVHCASATDVMYTSRSPMDAFHKTIAATVALLEKIRVHGATTRFVLMSSHSVYGKQKTQPISEEACLYPPNLYGALKAAQEHIVLSYQRQHGVPTAIVRSTTMYGPKPRAGSLVVVFLKKILKGETITIEGDGLQTRDLNYLDNTAQGVALALREETDGQIYNIGAGYSPTIIELADLCAEVVQEELKVEHVAPRGGEEGNLEIDIAKAQQDLGYEPAIPLKIGIARTARWLLLNDREVRDDQKAAAISV